MSAPRPPVIAITRSSASSLSVLMTASAPSSLAFASRTVSSASRPTIATARAPAAFTTASEMSPIGPGPVTTAESPAVNPHRSRIAVAQTAIGSSIAPSSKETESGRRWSSFAGPATYFA